MGHLCIAHCDCLGLSCSVAVPVGHLIEYIQIGISFNTDEEQLEIDYNGENFVLISDGKYIRKLKVPEVGELKYIDYSIKCFDY